MITFMVKFVERAEWAAMREKRTNDFNALETVRRALILLWEIEKPCGPWQEYAAPLTRNATSERAFALVAQVIEGDVAA